MPDDTKDWVGQALSGGRYRIDAKLGEGGMGFVYKVWDRNLDTDVVIKTPRRSMLDDPDFANRFALEVRSLVKLSHPNIVKISDVGEHDGLPFAVMPYLTGGTLDERQQYDRNGRPLPAAPGSLASWLPGMAAALDFIHGKGYIHRDVKPANILFDVHGHPYLSDFGVAKVLSDVEATSRKGPSGMTGIGIVLGTPEYMAPELIMGTTFDGKVDQYALAVTAYEILCGRKPFVGETATAILVHQTNQEPPPMVELASPGRDAIARTLSKAMAKKPADRFVNCSRFAQALLVELAKSGTSRPSDGRLACPSCGIGFAATADLTGFKGRKSKCRACGSPFRIADDGLSLIAIDPEALPSPSGSISIPDRASPITPAPQANRIVKLDARPSPRSGVDRTMKLDALPAERQATARASGTVKLDAIPSPGRASATRKLDAILEPGQSVENVEVASDHRQVLLWVVGAIGVMAASTIVILSMAMRNPGKKSDEVAAVWTPPTASTTPVKPMTTPTESRPPTPIPVAPPSSTIISEPEKVLDPAPPPPVLPVDTARSTDRPPDQTGLEGPPETEKTAESAGKAARKAIQGKESLTLRQLVGDPGDYLDQVVCPTEVLLVTTLANHRSGADFDLAVRSVGGAYQSFLKPGTDFEIVLKPEMARQLNQAIGQSSVVAGDYPAIMGLRIEKAGGGNQYRGLVDWMELLYYVDARPLDGGAHNVTKALFVLAISGDGAVLRHSQRHKEWETRLAPTKIIPNVRNTYIYKEGRPHAAYTALAVKATRPDHSSAIFFHNWIKAHIH